MIINLYIEAGDAWVFETQCDVEECFPDDAQALTEAMTTLERDGEYVTGGGAAPIFKIRTVRK